MDFFYGYGHAYSDAQVRANRMEITDAKRMARKSQNEADELGTRIERLHLATMAMWELFSERLGVTEEQFLAKVQEIDLRDGRLDGRLSKRAQGAPVSCGACGRTNHAKRSSCLYCTAELPPVSPL